VKSTPATARKTAELFVFNLDTRQLERRLDFDDLLPGVSLVTQVRSTNNWQSAALVKTDGFGYRQATTNVDVGGQIYSINARIGEVSAAGLTMNPGLLQSRD